MLPVARIDDHRMQHRTVGCSLVGPLRPRPPHRVFVPSRYRRPCVAAIVAAKQALRRTTRVPDVGIVYGARGEPDHATHAAPVRVARFERGRPARLLPRLAEVTRAQDRWAEVAGARPHQQRLAIAGIEHDVLDDVAEKHGSGDRPRAPLGVGREQPGALASAEEEDGTIRGVGPGLTRLVEGLPPLVGRTYAGDLAHG